MKRRGASAIREIEGRAEMINIIWQSLPYSVFFAICTAGTLISIFFFSAVHHLLRDGENEIFLWISF